MIIKVSQNPLSLLRERGIGEESLFYFYFSCANRSWIALLSAS